jgi:mRNA interferase RelE/StbE
MALYKVEFKVTFQKDLRVIPKIDRKKILQRIDSLAINPRPPGCEKLTSQNKYRVRQGDYRILYTIDDDELKVRVMKVGHRKDIYRVSEQKTKYMTDNPKSHNRKDVYRR